eukprot:jgi/Orpsp1_1/1192633/evm.model.d7180000094759.1
MVEMFHYLIQIMISLHQKYQLWEQMNLLINFSPMEKLLDNHNNGQDSMKYENYNTSQSYDYMTNMATITSLGKYKDQSQSQSQSQGQGQGQCQGQGQEQYKDSLSENCYIGLSFLNSDKSKGQINSKYTPTISSHSKNVVDINDSPEIIEVHSNYDNESNDENNNEIDDSRIERNEVNNIDTTFTSLEFKDTVISNIENDMVSTSHINNNINYSNNNNNNNNNNTNNNSNNNINNSTFIPKSFINPTIEKSYDKIKPHHFKGKSPLLSSLPLSSQTPSLHSPSMTSAKINLPKLIDVPGNSSMKKIYAMEDFDEEEYNNTFLSQTMNYSSADATAADDTVLSIPKKYSYIPENSNIFNNSNNSNYYYNINNNITSGSGNNYSKNNNDSIHIISSHCTQKTSTYNYLPMDLLESNNNNNINITNFQIHTCKDSVLSPLIPCIACSNENKWKNKKFTTKLRNHFKKWMLSLTHSKQKKGKSMVYSSSATLTVPIYFGDQKASLEDQNRHHQHRHRSNDSNKKANVST